MIRVILKKCYVVPDVENNIRTPKEKKYTTALQLKMELSVKHHLMSKMEKEKREWKLQTLCVNEE